MIEPNNKQPIDRYGIVFVIVSLALEIIAVAIYSTLIIGDDQFLSETFHETDIFLVTALSLFSLIGFSMLAFYSGNGALNGTGNTLVMFALTTSHYFLFRAMWTKIVMGQCRDKTQFITYVNSYDRADCFYSLTDALICSTSLNIALISFIPWINLLESFILATLGTFFYTLHEQILQQLLIFNVVDIGYGFSVFMYGSAMGTVALLLNTKYVMDFKEIKSDNSTRLLGLVGIIILFITFPFLTASSIYRYDDQYKLIFYIAILNIIFALISGVLGTVCISIFLYNKIHVDLLVTGSLSGGVAYSCAPHLFRNIAAPLGLGFVVGCIQSIIQHKQYKRQSKLIMSISRFLFPSLISAIFSSIIIASTTDQPYQYLKLPQFSRVQLGGYQFSQALITLGLGSMSGLLSGLIMRKLRSKGLNNPQANKQNYFKIYSHEVEDQATARSTEEPQKRQ